MYADTVTPDGYQVNRDGAWIVNEIVQIKNVNSANRNMRVSIQANGNNLIFELNDSQAAREFYNQLPLSVEVRNFGGIEKIFYPPKTLNISDAPAANAEVGTLAYYAPWGNIAIFYGRHGFSSGLYELGRVVSGSEHIRNMSDSIEVSKE